MRGGRAWAGLLALLSVALSGCVETRVPAPSPVPPSAPVAYPAPAAVQRSATSLELERHYARVQSDLLTRGLLRTDGGGADTPFAAHNLASNFVRIALYDEYVSLAGQLVARQTASRLRRWEAPVRLQLQFGPGVPEAMRARDTAALNRYADRLRRATGHSISTTSSGGNFLVLIMYEEERRAYASVLQEMVPNIDPSALRAVENMPRETFCFLFAFAPGHDQPYTRAVAVIRAEHPDLLRLSCIHEEVAQGLGLANDSPAARPSIFNDDEEFALLTTQDELMLRILYDRRLSVGMTADEAWPTVNVIAEELMGSGS